MIENERVVGGLSCSQVLERLSDYLDGDLPAPERAQVEEHLRGCDACARFGGEFKGTVQALRGHLLQKPTAPGRLQERLRRALDAEQAKSKV